MAVPSAGDRTHVTIVWAASAYLLLHPTPSPSVTTLQAPPADPYQTAGAIIGIVLALVAGVIGYRIIRGGRGL